MTSPAVRWRTPPGQSTGRPEGTRAEPPRRRPAGRFRRGVVPGGLAALAALAGWLAWAAGRRGLFAFDQSILFDAGHRILAGQVPFEDFVLPFGPVAPALQALLFVPLGADWTGYLLSAALANAVAALLAVALLRLSAPERPGLQILAGLLTAIWFYPPSGTPWMDQTAFLCVLAGTVLLLPAVLVRTPGTLRLAGASAAGAFWVLALLTKQNAGGAALPLFVLLLALPAAARRAGSWRPEPGGAGRAFAPAAAWLAGAAVSGLAFALWVVAAADPELFVRHALEIPSAEGWRRIRQAPLRLFAVHAIGVGPWPARGVVLGSGLVGLFALGVGVWGDRRAEIDRCSARRLAAGGAAAVGLFAAQHLFTVTSFNQPEISAPFTGLLPPLAAGLALRLLGRPGAIGRRVGPALVRGSLAAAVAITGVYGLRAGFGRTAQDPVPPDADFSRPVRIAGLEPLLWARATVIDNPAAPHVPDREAAALRRPPAEPVVRISAADVEELVAALSARLSAPEDRFFVFPDWTLLYGLLGRTAPQPLVWFHEGLTYPTGGDPALDRWIVADLRRARVGTVVLETTSWLGTRARLADFPRLARYVEECFAPVERIGPFEIRSRVADGAPSCAHRTIRGP